MRLCPDCETKLTEKAHPKTHSAPTRYFCENNQCDVIEVVYSRGRWPSRRYEAHIKRRAAPRKVPLDWITMDIVSDCPRVLEINYDE